MNTFGDPFIRRTCIVLGRLVLTIAGAALLVLASNVILLVFAGVLFAVLVRGLSEPLSRYTGLPPRLSAGLVLLLMALLLALAVWMLAADVGTQLDQLSQQLAHSWRALENQLERYQWGRQLVDELAQIEVTTGQGRALASHAAHGVSVTFGAIVGLLIAVTLGVYLATSPGWYRSGLLQLLPQSKRHELASLLDSVAHVLRWWLFGRIVGMVAVGFGTWQRLRRWAYRSRLRGARFALLLDFVPFIGPVLAAIPAVMLALATSPSQALYVAGTYLGVQSAKAMCSRHHRAA